MRKHSQAWRFLELAFCLAILVGGAAIYGHAQFVGDSPAGPRFPFSKIESFTCVTDGSGNCPITFTNVYNTTPTVMFTPSNLDPQTSVRITALNATNATLQSLARTSLTVLSINLLSFATASQSGTTINGIAFGN